MKNLFWTLGVCLVILLVSLTAFTQTPTTPAPSTTSVTAASKGSLIKIDGRFFAGIFSSGVNGAYPNRAVDVPDAKIRFTFNPSKDITIVNRFSNNKAASGGFDYFYMDLNNWGGALPGHVLRIGKVKIDTGEETWTDNPEESILISNSAASVGGYDGGVNFRGTIPVGIPASYSIGVYNSNSATFLGSATNGLATGVKIGAAPLNNLYVSASYYYSGDLIKADGTVATPALKIANLQTTPAGTTAWNRSVWEADARWNYGKTGIKSTIPSGGTPFTPFQVGVAIGAFTDNFDGAKDRDGQYWYAEGLYNATQKLYLATRYSKVSLDDNMTAKLVDSTVAVNSYKRLSLGVGYHLTSLSDLKVEYSINKADGGATQPKLNQFAVGVATKF